LLFSWEEAYSRELAVNRETSRPPEATDQNESDDDDGSGVGEVGEVWFGEATQVRLLRWVGNTLLPLLRARGLLPSQPLRMLDVGCGNAMSIVGMAELLAEEKEIGFELVGVDYSANAIALASRVVKQQLENKELIQHIKLYQMDFLQGDLPAEEQTRGGFGLIFDKGTLDAISLSHTATQNKSLYMAALKKLLHPQGIFVITSWFAFASESAFSPHRHSTNQTKPNQPTKTKQTNQWFFKSDPSLTLTLSRLVILPVTNC